MGNYALLKKKQRNNKEDKMKYLLALIIILPLQAFCIQRAYVSSVEKVNENLQKAYELGMTIKEIKPVYTGTLATSYIIIYE